MSQRFSCRPATAQMVDDDSLVVGNPSRRDSSDLSEEALESEASPDGHSAKCYDNLYIVLLVHERVEQPSEFPIPDLRLGSALGAGDCHSSHLMSCNMLHMKLSGLYDDV